MNKLVCQRTQEAHEVRGDELLEPGVIGPNKESVQHLGHLRENSQTGSVTNKQQETCVFAKK